jgi:hypothetical protein
MSKEISPGHSFLPLIDGLNTSMNSAIGSSNKLSISLIGTSPLSAASTPKAKFPTTTPKNKTQEEPKPDLTKGPITPAAALKSFSSALTSFEHSEILNYAQVYFLGHKAHKLPSDNSLPNNGYDDELSYYKIIQGDHIAYRYEVLQLLGKGSFGQVVRCLDHKRSCLVALKIIRNQRRFHRQAAVEVRILQALRDKDLEDSWNIVHFKQYFQFRHHLVCPRQVISFELLSLNLYDFMKHNQFKGVSIGLTRRFAVQILQALSFMKQLSIVHCDLKPENVLLKKLNKSGLKVIDFGSACYEAERLYTYIQSRFYRAPEVMLGLPYTSAIDMWSFGCILAELFCGVPLFPGDSEPDQMGRITEVLGLPPRELLEKGTRSKLFFTDELDLVRTAESRGLVRRPRSMPLPVKMSCTDAAFISFLEGKHQIGCLAWMPELRSTPDEALQHPWILEGTQRVSTQG